jgi:hypothetical protein
VYSCSTGRPWWRYNHTTLYKPVNKIIIYGFLFFCENSLEPGDIARRLKTTASGAISYVNGEMCVA